MRNSAFLNIARTFKSMARIPLGSYPLVVSGDLDAALIAQPQFPILKSCGWRTLRQEPLVLIVSSSLEVTDPHRAITSEPFIRYDRKHWGGQIVDRFLHCNTLAVKTFIEMDAIATFVDRKLGVAVVPDRAPRGRRSYP